MIVKDQGTYGTAANIGAHEAVGEYIHFSADDIEPLPGWYYAGKKVVQEGKIPAPQMVDYDGVLHRGHEAEGIEVEYGVCPLLHIAQWELIGPTIPIHYYSDNWIGYKAYKFGWPVVITHAYQFIHHIGTEGNTSKQEDDLIIYNSLKEQYENTGSLDIDYYSDLEQLQPAR